MTPSARSLAWLRAHGMVAQRVEHWNAFARRTIDLFGIIDIVAIVPHEAILGIQVTTVHNLPARRAKALREPRLAAWLAAGGRFELHGWAKHGKRGERKLWDLTQDVLTAADFPR